MQQKTNELKEKLIKALDKENNVVDMCTVLEVVSQLEQYEITKECLEETRIGKYINGMRKQTSDKDLAKRAKNLVKKWQQLLHVSQNRLPSTPFNGDKLAKSAVPKYLKTPSGKPSSPNSRPETPLSNNSNSPGLQKLANHGSNNRLSPAIPQQQKVGAFKPVSPALQLAAKLNSPMCVAGRQSPLDLPGSHNGRNDRPSTPSNTAATSGVNKRKRTNDDDDSTFPDMKRIRSQENHVKNNIYDTNHTVINGYVNNSKSNCSSPRNSELSSLPSTTTAASATQPDKPSTLKNKNLANANVKLKTLNRTASSSSIISESSPRTPIIKTSRVKTTAQLLEEMTSSGSLNLKGSEAGRKIALNQIDKEYFEDSVVPAAAKPRPRKKPRQIAPPHTSQLSLNETKHEMVHKFLETSLPVPPTPDTVDFGDSSSSIFPSSSSTAVASESPHKASINNNSMSSFSNNGQLLNSGDGSGQKQINNGESESDHRRVSPVRIKLGARGAAGGAADNTNKLSGSALSLAQIISDHNTTQNILALAATDPWALLPDFDPDNIQWDSLDYEAPHPVQVTPSVIERIHADEWSGVNGQYDTWGDWRNWSQPMTSSSYNGDLLHILPYVVLEQDRDEDTGDDGDHNDDVNNCADDNNIESSTSNQT